MELPRGSDTGNCEDRSSFVCPFVQIKDLAQVVVDPDVARVALRRLTRAGRLPPPDNRPLSARRRAGGCWRGRAPCTPPSEEPRRPPPREAETPTLFMDERKRDSPGRTSFGAPAQTPTFFVDERREEAGPQRSTRQKRAVSSQRSLGRQRSTRRMWVSARRSPHRDGEARARLASTAPRRAR